jgi:hypothetical protein
MTREQDEVVRIDNIFSHTTIVAVIAGLFCLQGCSPPMYDVHYNQKGEPTAYQIIYRVRCELADILKTKDAYRDVLKDWDVSIALSLEVNNQGTLNPSQKFIEPFTSATSFAFGLSAELQESRDHTFTKTIAFPISEISSNLEQYEDGGSYNCNAAGSNLEGALGIAAITDLGFSIEDTELLAPPAPAAAPGDTSAATAKSFTQAFGGIVTFIVTQNMSGVGPTWTLRHFNGPGGLLGLSSISTNKLTIGFGPPASGPVASAAAKPAKAPQRRLSAADNPKLQILMQNMLTNNISTQLQQILQNTNH